MRLHDEKTTRIFRTIVGLAGPKPDAFLDMGPGVPESEAWGARRAWPDCKIIGLEPNESRFNAIAGAYPGTLLRKAIGPRTGVMQGFTGKKPFPGRYTDFKVRISDIERESYRPIDIECTTIDSLCDEYGPFSRVVVWADIERGEIGMIAGAAGSLSAGIIKVMYVEAKGGRKGRVASMLAPHGFAMAAKMSPMDYVFTRK